MKKINLKYYFLIEILNSKNQKIRLKTLNGFKSPFEISKRENKDKYISIYLKK